MASSYLSLRGTIIVCSSLSALFSSLLPARSHLLLGLSRCVARSRLCSLSSSSLSSHSLTLLVERLIQDR